MNTPFTLSFVDGSFQIQDCPARIAAGYSRVDAESDLAAFHNGGVNHQNGYEWVYLDGLSFDGESSAMSLCFYKGALSEVHWSVNLPGAELEDGWPTQRASDDEIAFVRSALARLSGKPDFSGSQVLSWGSVWSGFDAKGGVANSGVRYKTAP